MYSMYYDYFDNFSSVHQYCVTMDKYYTIIVYNIVTAASASESRVKSAIFVCTSVRYYTYNIINKR